MGCTWFILPVFLVLPPIAGDSLTVSWLLSSIGRSHSKGRFSVWCHGMETASFTLSGCTWFSWASCNLLINFFSKYYISVFWAMLKNGLSKQHSFCRESVLFFCRSMLYSNEFARSSNVLFSRFLRYDILDTWWRMSNEYKAEFVESSTATWG